MPDSTSVGKATLTQCEQQTARCMELEEGFGDHIARHTLRAWRVLRPPDVLVIGEEFQRRRGMKESPPGDQGEQRAYQSGPNVTQIRRVSKKAGQIPDF